MTTVEIGQAVMAAGALADATDKPKLILLRIEEDGECGEESAVTCLLRGYDTVTAPSGFVFQRCGGGRRVIRRQWGAY